MSTGARIVIEKRDTRVVVVMGDGEIPISWTIDGTSLMGGVGRMTGTVIGAVILGILTSGFTFLNVDAHYQEIIKGGVIIAAVVADQYRQRRRKSV